jgi:putative cardiolipin synthase
LNGSGASGVILLDEELEALSARLGLAAQARENIDVQYYIWTGDAVGIAVIKQLLRAALRGVRVRLLVDDIHFIGYDRRVLGLDAYENVEIRSFNPFRYRFKDSPLRSIAEIISGASRLNHRMHNKVFSVDGKAAILGGRNLSNEYFGAHAQFNFRDIDILCVGDAVDEISSSFDEYWHSQWAVPLQDLHKRRIKPVVMDELEVGLNDDQLALLKRIESVVADDFLDRRERDVTWCPVEVLADAPQKMEGRDGFASPVRERLFELNSNAEDEILIENGYFIPRDEGLQRMRARINRGVTVKVLTNSLASNDTGLSHAGYKRYRYRLLKAGVQLFETRIDAALAEDFELSDAQATQVGLHSKAATIDRQIAFVGSYNLDPRSAFINTEIGVIVHNAEFANRLAGVILAGMSRQNAWWLRLAADDTLRWQHDTEISKEPKAHWRKRLLAGVLGVLPVERQL